MQQAIAGGLEERIDLPQQRGEHPNVRILGPSPRGYVRERSLGQQERGREQLLALSGLRPDVVPRAGRRHDGPAVASMSGLAQREIAYERTLRDLHDLRQLIAALDRRVPQIERDGEVAIARASAELREAAVTRIEQLEREMDVASSATEAT